MLDLCRIKHSLCLHSLSPGYHSSENDRPLQVPVQKKKKKEGKTERQREERTGTEGHISQQRLCVLSGKS